MDIAHIQGFAGKKVRLYLKNKDIYSCTIVEVGNSSIKIIDKYGDSISIDVDDIAVCRPYREKEDL